MKRKSKLPSAALVATVHSDAGWRAAQRLRPADGVDLVELRLDLRPLLAERLRAGAARPHCPLLLTARHPAEGGGGDMTVRERRTLLQDGLPAAAAVDVELRSVTVLPCVLDEAAARGLTRIVSFHDFRRTPALPVLRRKVSAARRAGADVVKIATMLRHAGDLATLLILQARADFPLATMGMGPLGRVSRLVLAAAGSRLNYGYLDRPQVPGQWPAVELARRLAEVRP
jgi:3-dehydroquinate dehydratase-1